VDPSLHFVAASMFRELSRLFEVAASLANHATATSGATVVDVRTHVDVLGRDARRTNVAREPREPREPMVDVFNEGDHYVIVAEMRGVERADVEWHVRDGRTVVIAASSELRRYYREIELGTAVDVQTAVASQSNGVLELRLWKQ
jgi:HSP20 family molecular chaperone IbpA